MKVSRVFKVVLSIMWMIVLVCCVQDDDYAIPKNLGQYESQGLSEIIEGLDNGTYTQISIEQLKDLYTSYEQSIPFGFYDYNRFYQITSNLVVRGYVSSSDKTGNLYKEFYMQDAPENPTHAIGVLLNQLDSYNQFNMGREVYIKLKDMYVGLTDNEIIAVGGKPDALRVGQFTANQITTQLFRTQLTETIIPLELTINAINDSHIGMFVQLNGAEFPLGLTGESYVDPSDDFDTQRTIQVCEGFGYTNFLLETSTFASFKDEPLPVDGGGRIAGIISRTYGGDNMVLVLNSIDDVRFDQSRCEPLNFEDFNIIYEENFDSAIDNTTLDIEGWINYIQVGSEQWTEQIYSNNGYAEFSSYASGDDVNITWLISPGIDMDSQEDEYLNFMSAQHHLDSSENTLDVFVSTDFNGEDVLAATWQDIDVNLASQGNSWYDFVDSGLIDVSGYSGILHVAFKVTGSGTNELLDGGYQLDEFKILATE
ncbi:DUF5689 domain-containing protein [Mangrovimonas aestuarii]|uniref:DUF5689 domain-containing protein n=1 Tax=Mangrovimonas aestuarii TaxID=3018443 RepID=UPI002379BD6B|nr:DUF5689 domain-containing protein [Mangrovimonas aestuarii]